jgi:hypothetical protein
MPGRRTIQRLLYQSGNKARFTLGVRANVQPKCSIPIGAKVEIGPKGFTLGVKAENRKKLFNLPQVTDKMLNFYGFVLAPMLKKKDTIKFGRPICNPWG